jgi:hypothetical protein
MRKKRLIHAMWSAAGGLLLLAFLSSTEAQIDSNVKEHQVIRLVMEYQSFTQVAGLALSDLPEREAWRQAAPAVEEISIPQGEWRGGSTGTVVPFGDPGERNRCCWCCTAGATITFSIMESPTGFLR